MTQTTEVLRLLRERGEAGLTPIEALEEVGSFRLAARIADAKALLGPDEEIVTVRATEERSGKTFARYVLRKRVRPFVQEALW